MCKSRFNLSCKKQRKEKTVPENLSEIMISRGIVILMMTPWEVLNHELIIIATFINKRQMAILPLRI